MTTIPIVVKNEVINIPNIDKYNLIYHNGSLQLTTVSAYHVENIEDYIQKIENNTLILTPKPKIIEKYLTEEALYQTDLRHSYMSHCSIYDKMNNVVSVNKTEYVPILKDIIRYFKKSFVIRKKITIRYFIDIINQFECLIHISYTLKNNNIIHYISPSLVVTPQSDSQDP